MDKITRYHVVKIFYAMVGVRLCHRDGASGELQRGSTLVTLAMLIFQVLVLEASGMSARLSVNVVDHFSVLL